MEYDNRKMSLWYEGMEKAESSARRYIMLQRFEKEIGDGARLLDLNGCTIQAPSLLEEQ